MSDRGGGEQRMVPKGKPRSYYDQPVVKRPVWTWEIPCYFFVGGMAGASAPLAWAAGATGNERLAKRAWGVGLAGVAVSPVLLISDLGRPERFLNMLRVLKVTSPLSVGSFILAPFSAFSSAAAGSQLTGRLPRLGRLSGVGAAAFGPPLATYTAALLANTAVPAWHEAHRELPFVFAGSGATAAGGLAMMFTPVGQAGPARRMAVAGAAMEIAAAEGLMQRIGMVGEPYREGRPGRLMSTARTMTAVAAGATFLAGRRSRTVSVLAGATCVAASVLTRFGIFEAGLASARDPRYVVVPQRERLAAREREERRVGS